MGLLTTAPCPGCGRSHLKPVIESVDDIEEYMKDTSKMKRDVPR
jgi:hypothetical protein